MVVLLLKMRVFLTVYMFDPALHMRSAGVQGCVIDRDHLWQTSAFYHQDDLRHQVGDRFVP